jgi:hypothetical protein
MRKRKQRKQKLRFFLGLIEIAGHYRSLAHGLRELGHKATFVDTIGNTYLYEGRSCSNPLLRLIDFCVSRRQRCRNRWAGRVWRALVIGLKPALFLWALGAHDVFIFSHNMSFLRFYDLPLLKLFGKKIVYQFHGSDGRPRYLDAYFLHNDPAPNPGWLARQTRKQKRIINIGPLGHFHERPFVQWLRVGLLSCPLPLPQRIEPAPAAPDRPVRILHCPSTPAGKGTAIIRELIEDIRSCRSVEYIEVIGRPNAVVQDELRRCDFVIDQVYADYAMAGFATEAAWFAKPAVVGGLAVDSWQRELPDPAHRPPGLFCYPDQMRQAVLRMIDDAAFRLDLGRRARDFVEAHWTPEQVAEKILQALEGELSADWFVDPRDIRYIGGWGMPPPEVRDIVTRLVEAYGLGVLCVGDKPALEECFRRLLRREPLEAETGLASLHA